MVKDKVCRMTRRYGAGSYPTKQFLAGEARGRTAGPSFRHRPRALAARGTPEWFAVGAVGNPAGRPYPVVVLRGFVFVRFLALGEAFAV